MTLRTGTRWWLEYLGVCAGAFQLTCVRSGRAGGRLGPLMRTLTHLVECGRLRPAAITACTITLTAAREALTKQLSHMHTREYARRPDDLHVGPMVCMWAAPPTCMSSGLRAYQGVRVRIKGLTRMFKGLGAKNTPRPASLCPNRRPPRRKRCNGPLWAGWSALRALHHLKQPTHRCETGAIASLELRHAGHTAPASF